MKTRRGFGKGMNKMKQFIKTELPIFAMVTCILIIGIFLAYEHPYEQTHLFAENGTIDLKKWDSERNQIVTLEGEWLFSPNALLSEGEIPSKTLVRKVPHFWETDGIMDLSPYGYGTYQLEISGLIPEELYGLSILDEVTAYRLYVNEKLIVQNGVVGKEREKSIPQWKPIEGCFQADESGNARFLMEISNFDYYRGGFWNAISIGSVSSILKQGDEGILISMFLFSSLLIIGLINFVLFFLHQRKSYTTFYFSMFSIVMSFYLFMTGKRLVLSFFSMDNWQVLNRIEYFFGFLLLPIFGLLISHIFQNQKNAIRQRLVFKGMIVLGTVIVFFPHKVYTVYLYPYKIMGLLYILFFIAISIECVSKKQQYAKLILFALSVAVIAMIKEVFFGNQVSWLPAATLNFAICFSIVTLHKFLNIIHENEILGTKAIRDPLTGLCNRNYLSEINTSDWRSKDMHAKQYLMFLDLDGFKAVNDTYGHKTGDFVLQETGRRLKRLIRDSDMICRYGGDEFVVLINGELDVVKAVADRIIRTIKEPFYKEDEPIYINVSIGIAEIAKDVENLETVIRSGDQAMYEAKRNGGGQYVVEMAFSQAGW